MEPDPRHSRGPKLSTAFLQERMPLNHGVLLPQALGLCARHRDEWGPDTTVQRSFLSSFEAQIEQYLLREATSALCLDPSGTPQPLPQYRWCGILRIEGDAPRAILGCKSDHAAALLFWTVCGSHLLP